MVAPFAFPGVQVKIPPGIEVVAVNVAVCPKQIATLDTVIAGFGFTVIVPDTGTLGQFKLLVKTTV